MPKITVEIDDGGSYTEPLKRRLADYGITHGALSRESGIAESQLSRWFNKAVEPHLASIVTIERSVDAILENRRIAAAKARKHISRPNI